MNKENFYSVRNGISPNIYKSWVDCEKQIKGFSRATYTISTNREAALNFLDTYFKENNIKEEDISLSQRTLYSYVDGSFND
ncbi:RNase H1/viroplasmin domain-containing protein [uncultured Clostridium sp.]|uniref:RNase H1/viroplasmin domain-containing protein n=1 Tax=uncultured Clostridium sp. TaxID=59620 RepID=UPI0037DC3155